VLGSDRTLGSVFAMALVDARIPHCDRGVASCFGCKMREMRRDGVVGMTFQGGQYLWHDMTNRQFADRELEMARKDGRELVPVDKNGDRYF